MTEPTAPRAVMPKLHALVSHVAYTTVPRNLPGAVLAHTRGADWMRAADAVADAVVAELVADRGHGRRSVAGSETAGDLR